MIHAIPMPVLDVAKYLVAIDPRWNGFQANPGLFGVPIRKEWGVRDRPVIKVVNGDEFVGYIMKADIDAMPTQRDVERVVGAMEALMRLSKIE